MNPQKIRGKVAVGIVAVIVIAVIVGIAAVHMWEVYGTLKWGMSCVMLVSDHLSGRVRSVERATIGRRISENELDLLHLFKFGTI